MSYVDKIIHPPLKNRRKTDITAHLWRRVDGKCQCQSLDVSPILYRWWSVGGGHRVLLRHGVHTAARLHRDDLRGGQKLLLWRQVALLWRRRGDALCLLSKQSAREESGVRQVIGARTFLQGTRLVPICCPSRL